MELEFHYEYDLPLGCWHAALVHKLHVSTLLIEGDATGLVVALPAGDAPTAPARIAEAIREALGRLPGADPRLVSGPIVWEGMRGADAESLEDRPEWAVSNSAHVWGLRIHSYSPPPVVEICVRLKMIGPPVWRLIRLAGTTPLGELSALLRAELRESEGHYFYSTGGRCGTFAGESLGPIDARLLHHDLHPPFGLGCELGIAGRPYGISLHRTVDGPAPGLLPRVIAGAGHADDYPRDEMDAAARLGTPRVYMQCANQGHLYFATSRCMDRATFERTTFEGVAGDCPACGEVPSWRREDLHLSEYP